MASSSIMAAPPVNLETLATFLLAEHPNLTDSMHRVVVIALRDGRVNAGAGAHAGHVERVSASTILSGEMSPAMRARRDELLAHHEARHGAAS